VPKAEFSRFVTLLSFACTSIENDIVEIGTLVASWIRLREQMAVGKIVERW